MLVAIHLQQMNSHRFAPTLSHVSLTALQCGWGMHERSQIEIKTLMQFWPMFPALVLEHFVDAQRYDGEEV
jgi:hypothetical protein